MVRLTAPVRGKEWGLVLEGHTEPAFVGTEEDIRKWLLVLNKPAPTKETQRHD